MSSIPPRASWRGIANKSELNLNLLDDADEVRAHLRKWVAKWWIPETIGFVDDLPRTATGKISKKSLRDAAAG